MTRLQLLVPIVGALGALACGGGPTPEAKTCDAKCADGSAFRALRETLKLVYNITLQGNPEGEQDETTDCPQGGTARVFGTATSNATIGATDVDLTFELDQCTYLQRDDQPEESYRIASTGTVTETGVLAVQPTSTTALLFSSDSVTLTGTVFDPPQDYATDDCPVEAGQNGNQFSGKLCDREIAFRL